MSRYSNIEYVRRMPMSMGLKLITKATEESRRDKIYQQYLAELPALKGEYTFEKYYTEITRTVVKDTRPMDEIMSDILAIKT